MNSDDYEEPNQPPVTPPVGLGLDDVFYTLFRHKVIILVGLALGLAGAIAVRVVRKPIYESHAEINVPYISESTGVSPVGTAEQIKPTDPTGQSALSLEVRILTTFDLATNVAQKVGPEKILAAVGGGNDLMAAAQRIENSLTVVPTRGGSLEVSFKYPDERVVQPVLAALIDAYRIKSSEIHQGVSAQVDYLSRERDQSRRKLDATEDEIKRLKKESNVLFPDDTKEAYKKQIARVQEELFLAREALAKLGAQLKSAPDGTTNTPEKVVDSAQSGEYKELVTRIDDWKKLHRRLIDELGYADTNPKVGEAKDVIAELTKQKIALEKKTPALLRLGNAAPGRLTNSLPRDVAAEVEDQANLVARVEQLRSSLSNLQMEASQVMELEPKIAALQRRHDDEQKDYQVLSAKLERAQEGVASGNKADVRVMQTPTPPGLDNKKLFKMMAAVFAGCVGLGLGIAFLIDLVLDRSIKRSSDVKRQLHLPVLLTVPHTSWSGGWLPAWLKRNPNVKLQHYDPRMDADAAVGATGLAPWNPVHHLRRYTDGLRERLVTYFEVNHLTHRPKLVALTSCGPGVGVTSLATGLAASLSMTGDGNVLLVDMNIGEGVTHSFHKGKPGYGLTEMSETEEEVTGAAAANHYLASVSANGNAAETLSKALPTVFHELMPKLKVSGYDYIVFDMPPVSQTSLTPRLSSHMDIALMVIESEKTSKHVAAESSTLMRDARANVTTILNKCKAHVPAAISTGF